jgi:uncharacterized protein DUF5666
MTAAYAQMAVIALLLVALLAPFQRDASRILGGPELNKSRGFFQQGSRQIASPQQPRNVSGNRPPGAPKNSHPLSESLGWVRWPGAPKDSHRFSLSSLVRAAGVPDRLHLLTNPQGSTRQRPGAPENSYQFSEFSGWAMVGWERLSPSVDRSQSASEGESLGWAGGGEYQVARHIAFPQQSVGADIASPRQFLGVPLAGPPAGAAGAGGPGPLAKGWGWMVASGTVAGIDPIARTVTVAVAGQGRLEISEGGVAWRHQAVMGKQIVRLLPATLLVDAGEGFVPITAIHTGSPALVWGVVRTDSAVFALKLLMPQLTAAKRTGIAPGTTPPPTSGVVLRHVGAMLELLTAQGAHRSVIVTGATAVRAASGSLPASSIATYDLVTVEGTVNSDGSIAATRISDDVRVASTARVLGTVEQRLGDVEGLVVDGVMVAVSAETYLLHGSGLSAFTQLNPGQSVIVYGGPISAGAEWIGVRARVVVAR